MRRLRWTFAGPLLALAVAAGGCGGAVADDGVPSANGGAASPTASGSPAANDPDRARKFSQCMRDNGLPDFPDPGPDGRLDFSQIDRKQFGTEAWRKAMDACRSLAPNGGERRELDPAQQEQLRQWAQCMRDNGVDVPDPDPNGDGFLGLGQNGQLLDDPAFDKAMEACQDKFTFRQQGADS